MRLSTTGVVLATGTALAFILSMAACSPTQPTERDRQALVWELRETGDETYVVSYYEKSEGPGPWHEKEVTYRCYAEAQETKPLPDSCLEEPAQKPTATPRPARVSGEPPSDADVLIAAPFLNFTVRPMEGSFILVPIDDEWGMENVTALIRLNDKEGQMLYSNETKLAALAPKQSQMYKFTVPGGLDWEWYTLEVNWVWYRGGQSSAPMKASYKEQRSDLCDYVSDWC